MSSGSDDAEINRLNNKIMKFYNSRITENGNILNELEIRQQKLNKILETDYTDYIDDEGNIVDTDSIKEKVVKIDKEEVEKLIVDMKNKISYFETQKYGFNTFYDEANDSDKEKISSLCI